MLTDADRKPDHKAEKGSDHYEDLIAYQVHLPIPQYDLQPIALVQLIHKYNISLQNY